MKTVPSFIREEYRRCLELSDSGKLQEGLTRLRLLEERHPELAEDISYLSASLAIANEPPERASGEIENFRTRFPSAPETRALEAALELKRGNQDEALRLYEEYLLENEPTAGIVRDVARLLLKAKGKGEAARFLERFPGSHDLPVWFEVNSPASAEEADAMARSLRQSGVRESEVVNAQFRALHHLNLAGAAKGVLLVYLEGHVDEEWAKVQVARMDEFLGNYKDAVSRYEAVFDANPQSDYAFQRLLHLYTRRLQIRKALRIVRLRNPDFSETKRKTTR